MHANEAMAVSLGSWWSWPSCPLLGSGFGRIHGSSYRGMFKGAHASHGTCNGTRSSKSSSDTTLDHSKTGNQNDGFLNLLPKKQCARRAVLAWTLATLIASASAQHRDMPLALQNVLGLGVAHASLVQMPPQTLNNRYYLVRAGESEFEKIGIINTNPVAKTNMESGLSEDGKRQTLKAAIQLKEMGACEGSCWIWPSITQRAYQAAEIIAYFNNINRSRIVPEYSFLDARGLGAFEGKSLSFLSKVYETDAESPNLRPPPYTDGTPNESVADVFVRVTQLMSVLETQYFGESIIIVAPDSDNLSILQAALTGLDLRRHSVLSFVPGEVRYVDLDSRPPQRAPPSGLIRCQEPSQCG